MPLNRNEQIMQRREEIPRMYRGIYDRAVKGQSRSAAITVFCLECCGFQRKEVTTCTSVICPLWAVRPYQDLSQTPENQGDNRARPLKSTQLVLSYG